MFTLIPFNRPPHSNIFPPFYLNDYDYMLQLELDSQQDLSSPPESMSYVLCSYKSTTKSRSLLTFKVLSDIVEVVVVDKMATLISLNSVTVIIYNEKLEKFIHCEMGRISAVENCACIAPRTMAIVASGSTECVIMEGMKMKKGWRVPEDFRREETMKIFTRKAWIALIPNEDKNGLTFKALDFETGEIRTGESVITENSHVYCEDFNIWGFRKAKDNRVTLFALNLISDTIIEAEISGMKWEKDRKIVRILHKLAGSTEVSFIEKDEYGKEKLGFAYLCTNSFISVLSQC